MKHRLLTGLALAPLTLAALSAGPAKAASGVRVTTVSGAQEWRVSAFDAAEVRPADAAAAEGSEPRKQAADPVGLLAGGLVAAASAAFAGTAMVRRRKG